ncbi:recombination mediator RecR [Allobaculum sp. JKK-2023]|uniref:recombination mediator RecR n=1 Tax=Allobaculum sp. JKK-2023 TaxID=3108943 RepID=UPI002B05A1ED|nr:recombination mediator RecR [Allobaculum sp. JKK-2023]
MYPPTFENLILELHKLPGVGMKSAERMAFSLLGWSDDQQKQFAKAVSDIRNLKQCKVCGNLSENEICDICADTNRDHSQICVVQSEKDLYAIENLQEYKGVYHVLHGAINIQKGVLPDQLNIPSLEKRITPETKEVILALDPTMEGETTAMYLTRLLENQVLITKLAYGIPFGGKLDYTDSRTLSKAFASRQKEKSE